MPENFAMRLNQLGEHAEKIKCAIRQWLPLNAAPIGEYEVIQQLQKQGLLDFLAEDVGTLGLFKKHFLTKHCLYALKNEFFNKGVHLEISALRIGLTPLRIEENNAAAEYTGDSKLQEFYEDLTQVLIATQENVDLLLQQFWQAYARRSDMGAALRTLNLPEGAGWADIQQSYRRLAQQLHPDKGGDAAAFAAIHAAYIELKARSKEV